MAKSQLRAAAGLGEKQSFFETFFAYYCWLLREGSMGNHYHYNSCSVLPLQGQFWYFINYCCYFFGFILLGLGRGKRLSEPSWRHELEVRMTDHRVWWRCPRDHCIAVCYLQKRQPLLLFVKANLGCIQLVSPCFSCWHVTEVVLGLTPGVGPSIKNFLSLCPVPRFSHLVGLRPRLKTTHLQFFFFNQKIKNRPKLLKNRDVQEPVKRLKKLLRPLVAIKRVEEALKGKEERGWRSWYGLWWKLKKGGLQWLIRHKEEGSEKPWHLIPFVYFSFLKNTNLLVSKIVLSIILKKKRLYQKKYPLCKVLIDLDVFLSIFF